MTRTYWLSGTGMDGTRFTLAVDRGTFLRVVAGR